MNKEIRWITILFLTCLVLLNFFTPPDILSLDGFNCFCLWTENCLEIKVTVEYFLLCDDRNYLSMRKRYIKKWLGKTKQIRNIALPEMIKWTALESIYL